MPSRVAKISDITATVKRYYRLLAESRSLFLNGSAITDERNADKLLIERFKIIETLSRLQSRNVDDIIAKMRVWASEKEHFLGAGFEDASEDCLVMSSLGDLLDFGGFK